ncbi:hypothetical protein FB451DRAFT_1378442 [Mycena latifolia]|nr:hypothetical protein FB451DRAFT_1378442 [Mycena latifolia]
MASRRLDQALIDKVKMKRREEDSDASDSDADSTEMDEEDDKEVGKISDALRAKLKIVHMKRGRKENMKKTFRSDDIFVVAVVVMLRAPGMKGLLSATDDGDLRTKEGGSLQPESVAESQAADWDWQLSIVIWIIGDGSTIYNEGLNRIWSRSDELIESYDISDQDPQRVNINFLRRRGLVFLSQLALRQFLAVPGLRRLDLLP